METFKLLFPNMSLKPSLLNKDQLVKVVKTMMYIALSGAVSAIIAYATDHKELIGAYWPVVNFVLVALKQLFTKR